MSEQDVIESSDRKEVRRPTHGDSLRPVAFFKCLALRRGHDYVNSRSKPGHLTCVRCRYRRRIMM